MLRILTNLVILGILQIFCPKTETWQKHVTQGHIQTKAENVLCSLSLV